MKGMWCWSLFARIDWLLFTVFSLMQTLWTAKSSEVSNCLIVHWYQDDWRRHCLEVIVKATLRWKQIGFIWKGCDVGVYLLEMMVLGMWGVCQVWFPWLYVIMCLCGMEGWRIPHDWHGEWAGLPLVSLISSLVHARRAAVPSGMVVSQWWTWSMLIQSQKHLKEGRCLLDSPIIYNNYLYGKNNSQETVAKAKQSCWCDIHRDDNYITQDL